MNTGTLGDQERRRHPRSDVVSAIMISPNGHENRAVVFDLSEGGAKVGLPDDFEHGIGASVRLFFPLEHAPPVVIGAQIVRVAIDHLGLAFNTGQESQVRSLMDALSD